MVRALPDGEAAGRRPRCVFDLHGAVDQEAGGRVARLGTPVLRAVSAARDVVEAVDPLRSPRRAHAPVLQGLWGGVDLRRDRDGRHWGWPMINFPASTFAGSASTQWFFTVTSPFQWSAGNVDAPPPTVEPLFRARKISAAAVPPGGPPADVELRAAVQQPRRHQPPNPVRRSTWAASLRAFNG